MDNKELIWVDKDFAKNLWKVLEQEKVFDEYLTTVTEKIRKDFQYSLESMEEDAAIFTGLMLKTKQSFEKAKNEHLDASYQLWEKFEEEIPSTKLKTEALLETLTPLEEKLKEINSLMGKIECYNLDKFVESLSILSMAYGKNKEMIEFLVKHFGKDYQEKEVS